MDKNHRFRQGIRDRARVVCRHCHTRKVKCDLQDKETCSNCEKYGLQCHLRPSRRTIIREKYSQTHAAVVDEATTPAAYLPPTPSETADNLQHSGHVSPPVSPEKLHSQYIGGITGVVSGPPSLPPDHAKTAAYSTSMSQAILRISAAAEPPSRILLDACAALYFERAYHRIPILDRSDVFSKQEPSIALQQALCMLGAMLRHPKGPDVLGENERYYHKSKTLIHTDFEQDPVTVLKVLGLLATRNIVGPVVLTTDCTWHWLGMAIRTLQQTGLHRESMCASLARPGTARRIAWYLFVQDKLVSTGLGRPTALKDNEFDVRPLTVADFDSSNVHALVFIELTKLARILSRVLDMRLRPHDQSHDHQKEIFTSLKTWVQSLPPEVRIFDAVNQGRVYHQGTYELHIIYFATIITFLYSFNDSDITSVPNIVSLIASSCMTSLYHELELRDDINYLLGIHMWLFITAAVPQLLYHATEALSGAERLTCSTALDTLVSCLEQVKVKIPGAAVIQNTIIRLKTQDSRSQGHTLTVREWKKPNLVGELRSVAAFQSLFPFPSTLSPRLDRLGQTGWCFSDIGYMPEIEEDLGWIFDGFADVSSFTDWPSVLS